MLNNQSLKYQELSSHIHGRRGLRDTDINITAVTNVRSVIAHVSNITAGS